MTRHQNIMTLEKFGASAVQDEPNRHPDTDEALALGPTELAAMLHREHAYIAQLLERLSVDDVAEDRSSLWGRALTELVAHTDAEEDALYTPLVRSPALQLALAPVLDLHGRIRDLLQEMAELDPRGPQFFARLDKLRGWLGQHLRAQAELLVAATRVSGLAVLDEMCSVFLDRKMDLLYTA